MTAFYVDPVSGSDANAGTSFGAAWATTQHALDTVAAGDEVRLCKTGTETAGVQIDVDQTSGIQGSKISLISYNAAGTAPEDGYTIQASAAITAIISVGNAFDHYRFEGITFDGNANATYTIHNTADSSDYWSFVRCRFTGATSHGVYWRGSVEWVWTGCDFDNNGGAGLESSTANRGPARLIGGRAFDNTGDGINLNRVGECLVDGMRIYGNGGHGIDIGSSGDFGNIVNCTIYDNDSDGINMGQQETRLSVIVNTTIVGNGGYGIGGDTGTEQPIALEGVHLHDNTNGATQFTVAFGSTLSGDPLFEDAAGGDFRLGSGSPLIGAGVSDRNIGAMPQVCGASGGGGPTIS